ncbi:autotransporter outer membrane beta-barrel domain-containing protein [Roseibium sp. M-1]
MQSIFGKQDRESTANASILRRKALLLTTVSVTCLMNLQAAYADDCVESSESVTCTFLGSNSAVGIYYENVGTQTDGDGKDISITNYATQQMNVPYSHSDYTSFSAWYLRTEGDDGVDSGAAKNGGDITIYNDSGFIINVDQADTLIAAPTYGVSALSYGGEGDQDNGDNNSNGGTGGHGGDISVSMYSGYSDAFSYSVSGSSIYGFTLYGLESRGGLGGAQNNFVVDDQLGGDGGDGGSIHLDIASDFPFLIGSSSNRFTGAGTGGGFVASSFGGNGGQRNGNAGSGGTVEISNDTAGSIYWYATATEGTGLFALAGYSLGGNGSASTDNSDNGGNGGAGGAVTIENNNALLLDVSGSVYEPGAAILARSAGGDGGTGPSEDKSGGDGGQAGAVTVTLSESGSVSTRGDNIFGIVAQSIGGNAGDGGDGTALAGTGGGGGFGGDAGSVTVTIDDFDLHAPAIQTTGDYSSAIIAHSVGGGGGTGSDFVSVLGGQSGNGGNGGNAGDVLVSIDQGDAVSIMTTGDHAFGVVAQSIAGSGGAGGVNTSTLVSLGGDGAGGGAAGTATVNSNAAISTQGFNGLGIVVQSIGGGGGAAGSASGFVSVGGNAAGSTKSDGGAAGLSNTGTVTTSGEAAVATIVQSIGGGGGSGGDASGIAGVGGTGSAGGDGGTVAISNIGTLLTSGDWSAGAIYQSIGGGGGNGGSSQTLSNIVSIGVGGAASGGGSGGTVCVNNTVSCDIADLPDLDASEDDGNANVFTYGDFAPGMIAQSVGGGGGNGGSDKNYSVNSFIAFQTGGMGGAGGAGGDVSIRQNSLSISTAGAQSAGLIAQSIGGGGGTGGSASYFDATIGFNAALILGGSGGDGGNGSSVTVDLSGSSIVTGLAAQSTDSSAPNNSIGVLAQSIGGGGGSGGAVSAKDLLVAAPTGTDVPVAFNFQAAVGGNGGNGGYGGRVRVKLDQNSAVTTIGDAAHGIMAQSIGGGGGSGGDASVLTTTLGDKDTVEVTAGTALGGGTGNIMHDINNNYDFNTSSGGNGNDVTVALGTERAGTNSTDTSASRLTSAAPAGTLLTVSDGAHGVLAQSIGGGGGNGGIGNSNAYSQGGVASVKAQIDLGGQGGSGGFGGEVDVYNYAGYTIQTQGSGSKGLVAQSIGGGGGNSQGGTLYVAADVNGYTGRLDVGIGAIGGDGGSGGVVYVEQRGVIETFGGDADGVVLQSIGGGGGIGGSLGNDASSHKILDLIGNLEDDISRLTDAGTTYQLTVDVGGKGGSGGAGDPVQYYHAGRITTYGDWADGVVLQSIGGGGGQGGSSVAAGSTITANVEISVGGRGGTGGDGGQAEIWIDGSNANSISTYGYGAFGMLLQSIGGGGGQGGDGSDSQTGTMAIGGDGGGTGGAGGNGGQVQTSESSSITITTAGDDAFGFVAQSIGGGGGTGGVGSSSEGTAIRSGEISASIGGKGGVAGDGGEIDLDFDASISTLGSRASGILLQSIGGGGGLGVVGSVQNNLDLAIGGKGGAAGDGGDITLDLTGGAGIVTKGNGAHGIIAQSIGGGGGLGGDPTGGLLTLRTGAGSEVSDGASGDGGTVTLNINAPVYTYNPESIGILAQSIGGGGGFGGTGNGAFAGVTASDSSGSGGDVALTVTNAVSSTGERGIGIFAQSQGPDGNGQIDIAVNNGGTVTGGYDNHAAAIRVAGGNDNALVLNGDAVVQSGAYRTGIDYEENYAVHFNGSGTSADGALLNVTVNDTASLSGDVLLSNDDGNTAGTVTNNSPSTLAGGYFYGANVVNNGRFLLNRESSAGTTVVTGDFQQSALGTLVADIDLSNAQSDLLDVRGNAVLSGTLGIQAISLLPNVQTRFLTVSGTSTGTLTPQASLIFDYEVSNIGPDHYFSINSADFTPTDKVKLNSDQSELAGNLQQIWDAGGNDAFGALFGVLANQVDNSSASYAAQLSELLPQTSLAPAVEQGFQSLSFSNSLMSCPVFEGDNALLSEGSCYWARAAAGTGHRNAIGRSPSYGVDALTYSMGAQGEVAPGWFVGGAAAIAQSWLSQSSGSVSGKGTNGFLGLSLKHEIGNWTLAGALSGGYGTYDINRRTSLPGISETLSSSPDIFTGGVRARIARTFAASSFYAKPYVDLDAVYTHVGAHQETGVYGLKYDGSGDWIFAASPSLEIGSRYTSKDGTGLRLFGRVGMTFLSDDSWETSARFAAAPTGTGSFRTSLDHEDLFASIGAGLEVSSTSGFDLRVEYEGNFSDKLATNSGSLRLSIPF